MLSRQDRRQVILIYTIGIIVLLMACATIYRVIYEPLRHELRYLHQQISDETPNSIDHVAVSLGEYAPWMAGLHVSEAQLRSRLTQLMNQAHVQLKEMRLGEKQLAAPFYEMPIHLKLTGSYFAITHFLVSLANAHLIFNFKKIVLAKSHALLNAAIVMQLRML